MKLLHWLKPRLSRHRSRSTIRRKPETLRKHAPAAERLEDRTLLATFLVNTTADSVDHNPGDGVAADSMGRVSLRAAIMEANALAGDDTITLPAETFTLSLTGNDNSAAVGDLDVTDTSGSLTINGAGSGTTVIDANSIDRVFHVRSSATLSLSNVTVTGGSASSGGGIYVDRGTLEIADSEVSNNASSDQGGGIFNQTGTVTITDSTIADNTADGTAGGLFNNAGQGTAVMTVVRSTVSGNTSGYEGGGIFSGYVQSASSEAVLIVTDSTIANNSADYIGGGLFIGGGFNTSTATITGTTISGNTAQSGSAGIHNSGNQGTATVILSNSTISGNTTTSSGGGLRNAPGSGQAIALITNSTITDNSASSGGGILNGGTAELTNTIVAGNVGGSSPDIDGGVTSHGHNLIGNSAGGSGFAGSDLVNVNPLLGPLQNNGGLTMTHALLSGSPAIDAGDDALAPATDQRGTSRPQGAATDIGAYEEDGSTFVVNTTADTVDVNPGDGLAADVNGNTSLRAAVMEANASLGANTIRLPAGTYLLTIPGVEEDAAATGDLDVTDTLTLIGAGAGQSIIDANQLDRVVDVKPGVLLNLNSVTVTGGNLTSTDLSIDLHGGGIRVSSADVTIRDSEITSNSISASGTSTSGIGGGISLVRGNLDVFDSTISNNSIVGVDGRGADGGGIYMFSSLSTVTIVRSTLSGNSVSATGGGGAIGAAITLNKPDVTIINSTVSGNSAVTTGLGEAIRNSEGILRVVNTTITDNTSGIFTRGESFTGTTSIRNSIVAGNVGADITTTGSKAFFEDLGNNILDGDPRLGPLQDNGGPTFTHALLAGSPAIDAGDDAAAPSTDQRGVARPQGDHADIGAYEASAALANSQVVFSTDFNSAVPSQFSGITTTEPVQGFDGIGTGANVFDGSFLRNTTAPGQPTRLTLTGLPAHESVTLNFLLAVIDSWDSAASQGPDVFTVTVDGVTVFQENFANADSPNPLLPDTLPDGVRLAAPAKLGFNSQFNDTPYNLGLLPEFNEIPHSASTLTIEWSAGASFQGGTDESWAIDNVEVVLNGVGGTTPPPSGDLVLDLADIVGRGDGTGTGGPFGIDPRNGVLTSGSVGGLDGSGTGYSLVGLPFVDGVFVPDGGTGPVAIDSAGHTFDLFPDTDSRSWDYIQNGRNLHSGHVLNGVDFASAGHSLIGMHSNKGITFDLDAIRSEYVGRQIDRFTAVAGGTGSGFSDFWVLVDGVLQASETGIKNTHGGFSIDVPIGPDDRFLTLVASDGGNAYFEDQVIFGDPTLVLTVPLEARDVTLPAGGVYELVRDGSDVVVREQGGAELLREPRSTIGELTINGTDGDDTFIVDFASGDPLPFGDVVFHGGGQTGTGDTLEVRGGSAGTVTHTFTNASDGQLSVDGARIVYTGLEPIVDNLDAVDRVFSFAGTADVITLSDGPTADDGMMRIESVSSSELIDFAVPSGSLRINAGGGHDDVTLASVDSLFTAELIINGQSGHDDIDATALGTAVKLWGGSGNDTLRGGAGVDALNGQGGDDRLVVAGTYFQIVRGGNGLDVLALGATGLTLDLTSLDPASIDVERFDITGSGANTLTTDLISVRDFTSSLNELIVIGNGDDTLDLESGWNVLGVQMIGGQPFTVLEQSDSRVKVSQAVTIQGPPAAPHPFDLRDLLPLFGGDGSAGYTLEGIQSVDWSGVSVASAGDVNGDGFEDVVIGAPNADANGDESGETYIIFSQAAGWPASLDLSTLDGTNGITIRGKAAGDLSGTSVSGAGDVNGDGFDDVIIGAPGAKGGSTDAGESYVVYGQAAGFPAVLNLSTLDGTNGFAIRGINVEDGIGDAVSSAGDVNGDGLADVVIGALTADPSGENSGQAYVVFGRSAGFPATFDLFSLDGSNGFIVNGEAAADRMGAAVGAAGDVNGDGYDDVILGAYTADPNGGSSGRSYVVYGQPSGMPLALDLSTLDGSNGFVINGANAGDQVGRAVSSAGDVNGDGVDDLIIGATQVGSGGSGESYVVFGHSAGLPASLELSALDGTNGFRIDGVTDGDRLGRSVGPAGDVNGDGFDDLIVGAFGASPRGHHSGESYVVFGRAAGFAATLALADLDGTNGFALRGIDIGDNSGRSVQSAGDVNGDGFDDLVIGANRADAGGFEAGQSYVVFGGDFTAAVTHAGDDGDNVLNGTAGTDAINGGRGNDTLVGSGGADVLLGAEGDDVLGVSDLTFARVAGGRGSDTLRLDGSGISLDLATIADNRLTGIEAIDITGSGGNVLTLSLREVLNLSDESNTLVVTGDADDRVEILSGWTHTGTEMIGGTDYDVFTQGEATLKIAQAVDLHEQMVAPHPFRLSDLLAVNGGDGSQGFVLNGSNANDWAGVWVRSAGDVNADGLDDVVIGAQNASPNGAFSGEAYVVYGSTAGYAAELELSALDGTNGFTIHGVAASDLAGAAVDGVGDVNGDGIDDLLIGAPGANNSGRSYVVFGQSGGFAATLELSSLNGANGFVLDGLDGGDEAGYAVAAAGDVNGDGLGDLFIGAYKADPHGSNSGESYVVFGNSGGFPALVDFSALDGSDGFRLNGLAAGDRAGFSVASGGDVNGDGLDDLLIGAYNANPHGAGSGQTYVVFGRSNGFAAELELSSLDGTNGFTINGIAADDQAGRAVSTAGDVNGDGIDDILIGATQIKDGASGEAYVVFGQAAGLPASFELSSLDGTNGFVIEGINDGDRSGRSVGPAGDINGDGIDDLLVGAFGGDPGGEDSGEVYVLFGATGGFGASVDPAAFDGTGGFAIHGIAEGDNLGRSVSTAGDINGDGFDDLILAANRSDVNGFDSGQSYVLFGRDFTGAVTQAGDETDNTLAGTALADVLNGAGGHDTLVGAGGSDALQGGAGDDVLAVSDLTFLSLRGGRGNDTLRIDGSGMTVDLTAIADNRLRGIEAIDITGSGANSLVLNHREVVNLSNESNTVVVTGDGDDTLALDSGWALTGSEMIGGANYDVYTQGEATVKVAEVVTVELGLAFVSSAPVANAHKIANDSDISATFNQNVDAASVTDQTFIVHAAGTGRLLEGANVLSVSGDTVTLDPALDLKPGERIDVTATAGIQKPGGGVLETPTVWQFWAGVAGGTGEFSNDGQLLGDGNGVALADFDADGDLDIFVARRNGDRVLFNDGTGHFVDGGQVLGTTESRDAAVGDLDGDGDVDIYTSNSNRIWLNDGSGVFVANGQNIGKDNGERISLADLDADGDLDAFIAGGTNRIWINDGSGIFTNSGQSLGPSSVGVELVDVDTDGDLDAVTIGSGARVWLNDGSGQFADSGQVLGTFSTRGIAAGDLDADGDVDLMVGDRSNLHLVVWMNNGNGFFTDSGQQLGNLHTDTVRFGDVDIDGDLDAVVANAFGGADKIWINDGTGQFTGSGQDLGNTHSVGLALGDLDGDGDLDVATSTDHGGDLVGGKNTTWFNVNAPAAVNLPNGGGTFEVLADGGDIVVREQGGPELFRDTLVTLGELIVNGSDDDDTLIVDFSGGDPIPVDGLTFNGGNQTGAGDTLELVGGTVTTVTHNFTNASDGTVDVDGSTIVYTGLEPITDLLVATDRIFNFGDSADDVTLSDGPAASDGMSQVSSVASSESVDFANPTGSLVINAGAGNDTVTLIDVDSTWAATIMVDGEDGDDLLDAGQTTPFAFNVKLAGGQDQDTLWGGSGDDELNGNGGHDSIFAGAGNDNVMGGAGNDSIAGQDGDDFLNGQGGDDTLQGHAGNDTMWGDPGDDEVRETADADFTLTDRLLVGVGIDNLRDFERAKVTGGVSNNYLNAAGFTGRVTLTGDDGDDTLIGAAGNDLLDAGAGNDSLRGNTGDDSLVGGDDHDTLNGQAGNDTLIGGAGNDGLSGMFGNDSLEGGDGQDTLLGGSNNDTLLGGLGDDIALGEDGVDLVDGQDDADTVTGGGNGNAASSNDTVLGETIDDAFFFDAPWVNV